MANREPKDASILAARIALAFPSLSAYSAATLAESLCSIERAQRRHAERCCSGSDGVYVRLVSRPLDRPSSRLADAIANGGMVRVYDPEAEERAGERIRRRVFSWRDRLATLLNVPNGDAVPTIELQHDPRGRVLLVKLPGELEEASV